MTEIIIISVAIIVCLALSAFFSASEMAFSSCNTVRLENLSEEKGKGWKRAKSALAISQNFDTALSTILIGNNLVNIAASSLASVLLILVIGSVGYTWISTVVLIS